MDKSCARCGNQLQPDQTSCAKCGAAWAPAAGSTVAAPRASIPAVPLPPVPQGPEPVQTAGAGRSNKSLVILAIVFVALCLGGWLLLRHQAAGRSSGTTASSNTALTGSMPAQKTSSAAPPAVALATGEVSTGATAATAADTEAAAGSKPCSLLTRAEMAAILGAKIVKVTTSELACNYFTDETLSADVETTWTGGKDAFAQVKGFNSAPGLSEPVAGIGDEAYMQAAGVLHVLKNDTYVVVNSRVYPDELKTESAIAMKAMANLK
jgi:hypothetical protein